MKHFLTITFIIMLMSSNSSAFVLNNAITLGQGKSAFALIASTNNITTKILNTYNTAIDNFAIGAIAQYGLLDNFDIMLGFGSISYKLTPNIGLEMSGGNFYGLGVKYNLFDESKNLPFSLGFLLQYLEIPADLLDTIGKYKGCDQDIYYKLIFSKNFSAFFPYIALGLNSRYLKIGDISSNTIITQIDIGYGTAITKEMFIGIELNYSSFWHDPVMDSIVGADTSCSGIGYSCGVQCLI